MKYFLIRKAPIAIGAIFAATFATETARADDPVLARALFKEGRALAVAGHYDEACPKFEESLKQEVGIGTLFNLADCFEKTGRPASAWARFLDAASMSRQAGQAERETVARARASQLEARLTQLVVEVQAPAEGLVVTKNGSPLDRPAWGSLVPVDPGDYSIEARAPGRASWTSRVTATAGPSTVRVVVPELIPEAASGVAIGPTITAPAGDPTAHDTPSNGGVPPRKLAAYALGGVGVAGIATGIVMGLRAKSKGDSLADICPSSYRCAPSDIDTYASTRSDATTARTVSIVGFAAGGAALATGAILYFTAPKTGAQPTQVGMWTNGQNLAGVRLEGSW